MGRARSQEDDFVRKVVGKFSKADNETTIHLSPSKPNLPEKRRGKRFPLQDHAIVVHKSGFLTFSKKNLANCVLDLSQGGARVLVSEMLEPGTKIAFELHLPKFKDTVKAKGKVRWVRYVNGRIHVGIMFTTLSDLDKTKLRSIESFYTDPHSTQKPKDYLPRKGS